MPLGIIWIDLQRSDMKVECGEPVAAGGSVARLRTKHRRIKTGSISRRPPQGVRYLRVGAGLVHGLLPMDLPSSFARGHLLLAYEDYVSGTCRTEDRRQQFRRDERSNDLRPLVADGAAADRQNQTIH